MNEAWDFSRLPEDQHGAVIQALASGDLLTLRQIHDQYQLSPYNYCCDINGLLAWFRSAVENGTIYEQTENQEMAE